MISLTTEPGRTFKTARGNFYTADEKGVLNDVLAVDAAELLQIGAAQGILPRTVTVKALPGQILHFDTIDFTADANGLIRDVPFDIAVTQIKAGVCVEATEDGTVEPAPEPEIPADVPETPMEVEASPIDETEPAPETDAEDPA